MIIIEGDLHHVILVPLHHDMADLVAVSTTLPLREDTQGLFPHRRKGVVERSHSPGLPCQTILHLMMVQGTTMGARRGNGHHTAQEAGAKVLVMPGVVTQAVARILQSILGKQLGINLLAN